MGRREWAADSGGPDPRRRVPRTDAVLADPRLVDAAGSVGSAAVLSAVRLAQQRARDGEIAPEEVADVAVAAVPRRPVGLRPVVNATGVLLHTNLGRAPLSAAARAALLVASGCTDVEYDLEHGVRARRGRRTIDALRAAVPAAGEAHVVNNNAAALVLAATTLASGREILLSRGEFVEIGDGFRLHELLVSTGARIREVGTTNRTTVGDYSRAVTTETGFILKVHPSNFRITGFTAGPGVEELSRLHAPVVVDIGSGLLAPDPLLPDEPDADTILRQGAALVTASGDKLLGGPQAGLLLGTTELVERLRRHPLARALRVDKLTLAALEATLRGPASPTATALHASAEALGQRARGLVRALKDHGVDAQAEDSRAAVGGGGAPGVELPSCAVSLPGRFAPPLRQRDPAVVGRLERGRLLLDMRSVPPELDDALCAAVTAVAKDCG
jgi:L-seryl-tRNA(Ser) seleniumtransferase